MSVVTDYRKSDEVLKNGLDKGPMYPYRFMCYMRDLMQTWFGNPDNILDEKAKSVLFYPGDTPAAIKKSKVEVLVAWPDNSKTLDKLPACTVYSTQATTADQGTMGIAINGLGGVAGRNRLLTLVYDSNIVIRTTSYSLTAMLVETIFMFLSGFDYVIQEDAGLSYFKPRGFTVTQLQDHEGNSKDVFDGTISCSVTASAPIVTDTIGPVFNHFNIK